MKLMNDKTIIGVFCYKRAAKLQRSMEALLANPECAEMDVVFFCDGPKGEQDKDGVMQTSAYINSLVGFKNIYKHYREKNISTGPNFKQGISWLCDHYDRFIVVEDDLVVTPNYITYLLEGLDFYKANKDVFCVTGFCFPIDIKDYQFDTIVHHRFCSYGWASWSDRVQNIAWDKDALQTIIDEPGFKGKLNKEGHDLTRLVKKQVKGTISTWDIQMQVHVARYNLKIIYPVISKGYNIGFDHESTNTFGIDYLKTTLDEGKQRHFKYCDANNEVPFLQRQLKKPYGLPALATRKIANTFIKYTSKIKTAASAVFTL